jgi:hypothetical protein
MGISVTTWDTLIEEMINAATDWLERKTKRRFKETTYTSQVHHGGDGHAKMVVLRQFPVTSLTAAQYRAGTPDSPTWTDFQASEYELLYDEEPRRVRIYQRVPRGQNNLRFTYVAGYKIDFSNESSSTLHTLPADVSDLVERMVVWKFKRRESEGKASEAATEASVSWSASLSDDDKELIRQLTGPIFA